MAYPRLNALDQALDIAGSLLQSQTFILTEEPLGYGSPIAGQTGSIANIVSISGSDVTITGLTGMSVTDVGNFLTISGAFFTGNNGTFLIDGYISNNSITISNPNAVAPDGYNGSIIWTERHPYRLEDDINYIRTDRQKIKGTTNWYDAVPTYIRPTDTITSIPTNLTNIAGKTTDAVSYNVNRVYFGQIVGDGYTQVTVTSAGNLKHSDLINETGIPVFDTGLFIGDWNSCYVHIVDGYTGRSTDGYEDGYHLSGGGELTVLSGSHKGERIFGITYNGSSISPNSVEVHFYSAPYPANYVTTHTPYIWEHGQTTLVNFIYGYNERLDQLDANAFRSIPSLGILTDASSSGQINNLYQTIGSSDGYTNLNGLLTNITAFYPFYNLPNATPTVVDALNTLNSQIGNRTYTGGILINDQTITASLQALSNAISFSTITRTIERLAVDINANSSHTLPGGLTYVLDGTNNGQNLFVFTRGVLRDPGLVSGGNDYSETSNTSITFYAKQKSGDHINYFTK